MEDECGGVHPQGAVLYEGSDVDMEILFMEMQDPQTNRPTSKLLKYHHPRRSLISFKESAQSPPGRYKKG